MTQKQLPQLQKRRNMRLQLDLSTSLWREACLVMMKKYFCHMGKNCKKPESSVNTERVQFYQFITRPSLSNIKPALKQKIVRGGCPAECLMHPLERAWENPFLCCCNTRGRYSLSALVLVLSPSVSDFYLLKWISAQKHVYYLARGELYVSDRCLLSIVKRSSFELRSQGWF